MNLPAMTNRLPTQWYRQEPFSSGTAKINTLRAIWMWNALKRLCGEMLYARTWERTNVLARECQRMEQTQEFAKPTPQNDLPWHYETKMEKWNADKNIWVETRERRAFKAPHDASTCTGMENAILSSSSDLNVKRGILEAFERLMKAKSWRIPTINMSSRRNCLGEWVGKHFCGFITSRWCWEGIFRRLFLD